jgi:hypothetical protein
MIVVGTALEFACIAPTLDAYGKCNTSLPPVSQPVPSCVIDIC